MATDVVSAVHPAPAAGAGSPAVPRHSRQAATVLAGNLGALVLTFLNTVVLARLLGAEGRGLYALLNVYPTILVNVGELGLRQATTFHIGKGSAPEGVIQRTILLLFALSSVFGVAVCTTIMIGFGNHAFTPTMILLALSAIPTGLAASVSSGVFLGRGEVGTFNRLKWIPALLTLILSGLLVGVLGFGVTGAQLAWVLGMAVMVVVLVRKAFPSGMPRGRVDVALATSMVRLGIWYAGAHVLVMLNYRIGLVFLERLGTPEQAGFYALGMNLAELVWQVPAALGVVVFSASARAADPAGFSRKVVRMAHMALCLGGLTTVGLCLAAPILVPLVFGSSFAPSVSTIRWLAPGIFVICLFKVLNTDVAGRGKPWITLRGVFPGIVTNAAAAWLLIPRWGADGAAAASSLGFTVTGILFWLAYCRETGVPRTSIATITPGDWKAIWTAISRAVQGRTRLRTATDTA